MADYVQKSYDSKIENLLSSNDGKDENDGMPDLFGKMNGMIGMFTSFTQNPLIKTALKYYGLIQRIQELIQDLFIFLFGVFLMDGII